MKVTLEITDLQFLKVMALAPITEEQCEKVMAAIHETPELDITEFVRKDKDLKDVSLAIAGVAIAILAEKCNIE